MARVAEARQQRTRTQMDSDHRLGNIGLWLGLAKARTGLGQHLGAAEAYQSVMALDGGEAQEARVGLVEALIAAEKWQEAVQRAREAVQQHQNNQSFRQASARGGVAVHAHADA